MFDARSLLEQLVRGGGQGPASQQPAGGGLGDILGQLAQAMGQQGQAASPGQGGQTAGGLPGGLGDILGQLGGALGQGGQPQSRNVAPTGAPSASGQSAGGGAAGGGLEDILKNMFPGGGQAQGGGGGGGGGGLMDVLGQVLGQATQGVREGAGRVDNATGASGQLRDILGKATGKSPEELMAQVKELIQNNQAGAGALAGGLGAILLGTRGGRSVAMSALKIGGLALIGGLAYKALQNYQQGKPPLGGSGAAQALAEAPQGSGFEAGAVTNDAAVLYIRAMIAAAASDGRIDANEQQKIIGSLGGAGLEAEAQEFLARELNHPATIEDLVRSARTEMEAVQMFTAARLAIELDTAEEHEFLAALAERLRLDADLVAHIDAEARASA